MKKIIIFLLILFAPIILVMVIIGPLASRKNNQDVLAQYRLPENFSALDVQRIVAVMRQNPEFEFYFTYLTADEVNVITKDAADILLAVNNKEELLSTINSQVEAVSSLSTLFTLLDVPDEFYISPWEYPQIKQVVYDFLRKEFLLTILGTCYKSTYAPEFTFNWGATHKKSALKLQQILQEASKIR